MDGNMENIDSMGILQYNFLLQKNDKVKLATANESKIVETAHILRAIADVGLEVTQQIGIVKEKERALKGVCSVRQCFSSCLRKVFATLDLVLDWYERSTKNVGEKKNDDEIQTQDNTDGEQSNAAVQYQKKEGVLRGLYWITGSYTRVPKLSIYIMKIYQSFKIA